MDDGDGARAAGPPAVEHADDLYGLDPAEFTAARNALVKRLRSEGQREVAAEVAALRRPPATAWALDQVARTDPDLVDEALATGAALRAATDAALGGDATLLKEASAAERAAAGALVEAAAALLGPGGEPAEPRLAATVRAAVLDEEVADQLRRGVLAADHDRSGLGLGGGFDLAAAPARHLRVVPEPGSTRSPEARSTGSKPAAAAKAPKRPREAVRGATVAERREAARARAAAKPGRSVPGDRAAAERDAEARAAAEREAADAALRADAEARRRAEEEAARAEAARLVRRRINELRTEATKATRRAARLVRVAEEAEAEAADARADADAASAAAEAVARDLAEAQAEADRLRREP